MSKTKQRSFIVGTLLFYGILSGLIVFVISKSGVYPRGEETLYYLYRGDFFLQQIKQGNLFPLWDANWYNGMDVRSYSPLMGYVLAVCQFLAGGNLWNGYLVFVVTLFLCGGICWLVIGCKRNRPWMGALLGVLWFFMPTNLYTVFEQGNLSYGICAALLPLVTWGIHQFLEKNRWKFLLQALIIYLLILMFHVGYGVVLAGSLGLYLLIYHFANRKTKAPGIVFLGILSTLLVMGGWVFSLWKEQGQAPDIIGLFQEQMQSYWITINPLLRLQEGYTHTYFGIAVFVFIIFGIFMAKKPTMLWLWTGLVVSIVMPGFLGIPLAFVLYGFMEWKSLKKPFVAVAFLLMVLDVVPSAKLLYGEFNGATPQDRLGEIEKTTLIKEAKEITEQRLTFIDGGSLGTEAAYLISSGENGIKEVAGVGGEKFAVYRNVEQLNQAAQDGNYLYLFDRCIEMGSDSVLIGLDQIYGENEDIGALDGAANRLGYGVVASNQKYRLYHKNTPESFGVSSKYEAIGIGTSAPMISLSFPMVEETDDTNLNHYTYEELSQYRQIYLAGFTYTDRESAEQLIKKLSENGVRVVILADGIPVDGNSGLQTFLGVTCQKITFSYGYPELDTTKGIIRSDLFPEGHSKWNTVYLKGLTDIWGTATVLDKQLAFYGTGQNKNLIYVGLNLTYHYALTKDKSIGLLLSEAIQLSGDSIPQRDLVPLRISQSGNQITIRSRNDGVNTTLAYQNLFAGGEGIYKKNNLTYVNAGETVIKIRPEYGIQGFGISGIGLILWICFFSWIKKKEKAGKEESNG